MASVYIVDCLFGIYKLPLKREKTLIGLTVYSQVFKENEYNKNCQILNQWIETNKSVGGIYLYELARGPEGSFSFLYSDFQDLFEAGSALTWAGLPDTPSDADWITPAETIGLIDDRGLPLSQENLIAKLS